MTQLTIRGLDQSVHESLKEAAANAGLSVNRYVVRLLNREFGEEKKPKERKAYHDLDWMFGRWTDEEADAFDEAVKVFDVIDPEYWK